MDKSGAEVDSTAAWNRVMAEQGELFVQVVSAEQVDLTDEGHQVALGEQVGLMAAVGQVVPNN